MIQVLFIGRPADGWAKKLEVSVGAGIEAIAARLPAAGVRQLESSPPDAVVLVDESSSRKPLALVNAIRERPLGALTPIILICPDDASDEQRASADVDAWLNERSNIDDLIASLRDMLGSDAWETETSELERGLDEDTATAEDGFVLEEILEEDGPVRLGARDIFGDRYDAPVSDEMGEQDLRRMLRAVRHEDYFSMLDIPRGAQTSTIRDAFHRQTRRWSEKALDFELTHRYHEELAEIRDALEDAWAVLGDPNLRASYLDQTTRK